MQFLSIYHPAGGWTNHLCSSQRLLNSYHCRFYLLKNVYSIPFTVTARYLPARFCPNTTATNGNWTRPRRWETCDSAPPEREREKERDFSASKARQIEHRLSVRMAISLRDMIFWIDSDTLFEWKIENLDNEDNMCEHCSQNFLEKEKALKDEIYEVVRYLFSTVRVNMANNDNLRVVWFSSLYICAPCDEANAKSWKWIQILNVFIEKLYPCPSVIKIKVEIRSFSVTCTYRSFDLIKGGNESKQRKSLEKYRGKDEYFSEEEKNKKTKGAQ